MKHQIHLFVGLCLLGNYLFSQEVSNVRAEARDAEGRLIEIFYTLEDNDASEISGRTYKVDVFALIEGDKQRLFSVSGDVGDSVRVGSNQVIWRADEEFPRFRGSISFELRVVRNFMILKPEEGTVMRRGNSYTFEWFGDGSTTDMLTLELYQYNTFVDTITRVGGSVNYTWDIPTSTPVGEEFQLRIRGTEKTNLDIFSEKFIIRRKIPLMAKIGTLAAAAILGIWRPWEERETNPNDGPLPIPPILPDTN